MITCIRPEVVKSTRPFFNCIRFQIYSSTTGPLKNLKFIAVTEFICIPPTNVLCPPMKTARTTIANESLASSIQINKDPDRLFTFLYGLTLLSEHCFSVNVWLIMYEWGEYTNLNHKIYWKSLQFLGRNYLKISSFSGL